MFSCLFKLNGSCGNSLNQKKKVQNLVDLFLLEFDTFLTANSITNE